MAINPPSDLVLDVARAADPQAFRASAARLQRSAAVATVALGDKAGGLPGLTRENFAGLAQADGAALQTGSDINPAYRKFEAFMLQNFVQSMFTGDSQSTFGKGLAGEYWKSMMSDAIAQKMAEGGGIGVAAMLAAGQKHAATKEVPLTAAFADMASGMAGDRDPLSVSKDIVHGFERQLIQKQRENSAAHGEPKRV